MTHDNLDSDADGATDAPINSPSAQIDRLDNRGATPMANHILNAGRDVAPVPTFTRQSGINPILTPSDITWGSGSELQSMEVVDTTPYAGARDNLYSYTTTHGGGGTGLLTAPDPTGPWTAVGQIDPDNEEGDVVYDTETGQFVMYRNTGNLNIIRATSPDGETWSNYTTVVESAGHGGYPRVLRQSGGWWLFAFRKNTEQNSRPVCYFSEDGETNFTTMSLAWSGRQAPSGGNDADLDFLDPAAIPWFDGYLVFYVDTMIADTGCDIRVGWTKDGVTISDIGVALDATNNETWEMSELKRPCPFWYNGDLWLFYGAGEATDYSIGLAKADLPWGVN